VHAAEGDPREQIPRIGGHWAAASIARATSTASARVSTVAVLNDAVH
jgi:hypothetical protein